MIRHILRSGSAPSWWKWSRDGRKVVKNIRFVSSHPSLPLLGVPETNIIKPEDVNIAANQAIQKIQFIRKSLRDHVSGKHPLSSVTRRLELLDAISNELCLAIDSAEFIRNAHQDSAFQQAASDSFSLLNALIVDLNADTTLYNILKDIIDDETFSSLSVNDKQVALDLLRDFKLEGIHLSQEHRQKLQAMNKDVSSLESQWSTNIIHSGTPNKDIETEEDFDQFYATVGPFPKEDRQNFQDLSRWLGRSLQQPEDAVTAQMLVMPREQRTIGMIMASVNNESLREKLWWEYSFAPRENVTTLPQLLYHRHSLANFLGYKHFAEKTLLKNIAKDTESVRELISVLSEAARPYARDVLDLFRSRKQYLSAHGQSTAGAVSAGIQNLFSSVSPSFMGSNVRNVELKPWDIAYLQHQAIPAHLLPNSRSSAKTIDPSEQDLAVKKIKEYFPISRCIEGLALVTESLFGVRLVQEEITGNEGWIQDRHPGELVKFHLFEADQHLGTVYIDLFRRQHKFPGAAHFTVRCGCETVVYADNSILSELSKHDSLYNAEKWQSKKQTPIVALVFPFQAPPKSSTNRHKGMLFSSSSSSTHSVEDDLRTLSNHCLSLGDMETLFHEWGHALHSLLSKSKYQHNSGTRGSTDFIEIPSHLFEFFARDPQTIRKWARHYRSGELIPSALLETALEGKGVYQGLDLQVQIALSLADQYLLSDETLLRRLMGSSTDPQQWSLADQQCFFLDAMDGIAKLQQQYTDLPVATFNTSSSTQSESLQWLQLSQSNSQRSSWQLPYVSMLAHRHFVGYAGSYHSYLYAKVVAAQIWAKLFAKNPLSREMGQHLRQELLNWGSSKPPETMLRQLLYPNSNAKHFQVDPEPYLQMLTKGLSS